MKNMNRVEIERFTNKYFPYYKGDIYRVSYMVYEDRVEYLINGGVLWVNKRFYTNLI